MYAEDQVLTIVCSGMFVWQGLVRIPSAPGSSSYISAGSPSMSGSLNVNSAAIDLSHKEMPSSAMHVEQYKKSTGE